MSATCPHRLDTDTVARMDTDILQVRVGFASDHGRRKANEDYVAAYLARGVQRVTRGVVAAVADGLGGHDGGREAAETAVRGFIDGYYQQIQTFSVERAAERTLAAINRWIHAQGRHDSRLANMATTFTALILRGRQAHVVHVGDTRAYRLREGTLERLSQDHTLTHPDLSHGLYRAVGIENALRIDYTMRALMLHDRFLLCSDGVHGTLSERHLTDLLNTRAAPDEDAQRVVHAALAAGSQDNATALILDVIALPQTEQSELEHFIGALPLGPLPKVDDTVDGFKLTELLSDGRYSRLFRAHDLSEGRAVVLKFPHPRVTTEDSYRRAFVREAWIAERANSPWVGEVLELAPGRQTLLYSVMPYYAGETLEQRLQRPPKMALKEGVENGLKLAKAVYTLNRRQIIHRDIKPDNILLEPNGGLRLMDLGVAHLPGFPEFPAEDVPGTPSYMAPELFIDSVGDERSDVYALGVTLYRMFSAGHYPYGEIEPFSTPRFKRRTPLNQHRSDLPAWLDATLARACAVDPTNRFADAMELAFELEHGLARGGAVTLNKKPPLYQRDPLRFWQVIALLLVAALIVALAN